MGPTLFEILVECMVLSVSIRLAKSEKKTATKLHKQQMKLSQLQTSGVSRGRGPAPQPSHKHTYELHENCQFGQFIFGKIIKTVATRSHL